MADVTLTPNPESDTDGGDVPEMASSLFGIRLNIPMNNSRSSLFNNSRVTSGQYVRHAPIHESVEFRVSRLICAILKEITIFCPDDQ